MLEICFSPTEKGACPVCEKRKKCIILNALKETLNKTVSCKNDNRIELTIYTCPQFDENGGN